MLGTRQLTCHPERSRRTISSELSFQDHVIVPGFVDAHAHPLYAGNREPDFAARSA